MAADVRTTSTTLLTRLRDSTDAAAWREFDERYRELMLRFCISRSVPWSDAEDVVQHVLAGLAKTLPTFVYDRNRGRFRDYLFRCVRNSIGLWAARSKGLPAALDTDSAANESNLGLARHRLGQADEAECLIQSSLARLLRMHGSLHPTIAAAKGRLASFRRAAGLFDEAENLIRESIDIYCATTGQAGEFIRMTDDLALLYGDMGRLDEAEELHRETLRMAAESLPENTRSSRCIAGHSAGC